MRTIQFDLGIEDYTAFVDRLNAVEIKKQLDRHILGPGLAIILAGLVPIWALFSITLFLSDRPLGGALLAAVCAYTVLFWIRWRRRCSVAALTRRVRDITLRDFESGGLRIPLGRQSVSLGADGVEFHRDGVESRYTWHAVDHIEIAAEHIYIFDRSHGAIIVPKRAFASPQDCEAFESEIDLRLAESRDRHPAVIRGASREVLRDAPISTTQIAGS